MASLKAIRKRIVSVRNTQQVTRAMKMVAAAKLRRTQQGTENARAYVQKLSELLDGLVATVGCDAHPLLRRGLDCPAHLVLITSDRGLCGGYNANLIRLVEELLASREGEGARITVCGRRGRDHFRRRGAAIVAEHVNRSEGWDEQLAKEIAKDLITRFENGEAGSVRLIYSHFRSALSQEAVTDKLLPIEPPGNTVAGIEYLYEPDVRSILAALVPKYVETRVRQAMLEATASEHGARMTAMDSATRNASEMIDRLTLAMNRARQAGITKELMEIVGGAEALKG